MTGCLAQLIVGVTSISNGVPMAIWTPNLSYNIYKGPITRKQRKTFGVHRQVCKPRYVATKSQEPSRTSRQGMRASVPSVSTPKSASASSACLSSWTVAAAQAGALVSFAESRS